MSSQPDGLNTVPDWSFGSSKMHAGSSRCGDVALEITWWMIVFDSCYGAIWQTGHMVPGCWEPCRPVRQWACCPTGSCCSCCKTGMMVTSSGTGTMNAAAFCTACRRRHDQLHWLDVPDRVLFQLAVTLHQCLWTAAHHRICRSTASRSPVLTRGGICVSPSPTCCAAFPAQHLRPSGVLSCWPDGLELTPGLGSNEQHRLF